jgi:hypothetical protein
MAGHDDEHGRITPLETWRRVRQERSDQALIELFAAALGTPLALRELTPEQQARRDARIAARRERLISRHGAGGGTPRNPRRGVVPEPGAELLVLPGDQGPDHAPVPPPRRHGSGLRHPGLSHL